MHQTSKKILPPDKLSKWRSSLPANPEAVAVVSDGFPILHPGNLHTINYAAHTADAVCAVIEPKMPSDPLSDFQDSYQETAEMLSHLQPVSAVVPLAENTALLKQLQPYTLVECKDKHTSFKQAAEEYALKINRLKPVQGCFTKDIIKSVKQNKVPITVPDIVTTTNPETSELISYVKQLKKQGKTIVTVNGCFDILHLGHLRLFANARNMGDVLIVLINDDESVKNYKGPGHPVFPAGFRLFALNMIESVSFAAAFSGDNPLKILDKIRPDIHVKGGTFQENRVEQEKRLLNQWGGKIEFVFMQHNYSTSNIINRFYKIDT
jgi:D-glycero-beta-D-manno-heptose 1-phosphate adenylyltransferase